MRPGSFKKVVARREAVELDERRASARPRKLIVLELECGHARVYTPGGAVKVDGRAWCGPCSVAPADRVPTGAEPEQIRELIDRLVRDRVALELEGLTAPKGGES